MNIARTILIKTLVRPYFRQNAGLFAFLIFIMFAAVGRANEVGLLEYHFALIRGMMINPSIFILVFLAWFLYARKCEQFVSQTLATPAFSFLGMLSLIDSKKAYALLLLVQLLLFLPVSLYVLIIAWVGFHQHWYLQVILVLLYTLAICLLSAGWYLYRLRNPGVKEYLTRWRLPSIYWEKYYWSFFIRYILSNRKLLFFVIKLYSCGILYLMLVNQTPGDNDLRMILLFYSFGLFGHGVLIHQCRSMEEIRLNFYRGLPIPLFSRYIQYAILYFLLFLPEIIAVGWLIPSHLSYTTGFLILFFGWSMLLLLNNILFIKSYRMLDYLKILVAIFCFVYIGVLTGMVYWLSVFCLLLSTYIFFTKYYRYEQ